MNFRSQKFLSVAVVAAVLMLASGVSFAGGLTIYIMIGIFLLERNFKELYGRDYEVYVAQRSKVIPWFPPRKPETGIVGGEARAEDEP